MAQTPQIQIVKLGAGPESREPTSYDRRIECWKHTRAMCEGLPPPPASRKVVYRPKRYRRRVANTSIELVDADCLECALSIQRQHPRARVLVLNLADNICAGGCVDSGSRAQEESLFRCTNVFQTLRQSFYPLRWGEAVYSPDVSVVKSSEATGWRLLSPPPKVDMVACPGICRPRTVEDPETGEELLNAHDADRLREKIRLVLQVAADNRHDYLVLGALGCGAWGCPSPHVARIFREVLAQANGLVPTVIFAILNTHGGDVRRPTEAATVDVFREVFAVLDV